MMIASGLGALFGLLRIVPGIRSSRYFPLIGFSVWTVVLAASVSFTRFRVRFRKSSSIDRRSSSRLSAYEFKKLVTWVTVFYSVFHVFALIYFAIRVTLNELLWSIQYREIPESLCHRVAKFIFLMDYDIPLNLSYTCAMILNSGVNLLIYIVVSKSFRHALIRFCKRCCYREVIDLHRNRPAVDKGPPGVAEDSL